MFYSAWPNFRSLNPTHTNLTTTLLTINKQQIMSLLRQVYSWLKVRTICPQTSVWLLYYIILYYIVFIDYYYKNKTMMLLSFYIFILFIYSVLLLVPINMLTWLF